MKPKFKRDQEASIVALQSEVQRIRTSRTIPVNGPVGESECNGRVENAIRRIQDKARTLKAQIEGETGSKIDNKEALMSGRVRWAGELATKFSLGKDGKTAKDIKQEYESRRRALVEEYRDACRQYMNTDKWKEYVKEAKEMKIPVKSLLTNKKKH